MLLGPQILSLRDDCLTAGVREAEFWDMTVGEAVRAVNAWNDRRKDMAYFAYTNAMAVGMFVGSIFSTRTPPTLEDIYPELFPKDEEAREKAEEEARMAKSAANFINFANQFNRRFNNGNRESESENNG